MKTQTKWLILAMILTANAFIQIFYAGYNYGKTEACEKIENR